MSRVPWEINPEKGLGERQNSQFRARVRVWVTARGGGAGESEKEAGRSRRWSRSGDSGGYEEDCGLSPIDSRQG